MLTNLQKNRCGNLFGSFRKCLQNCIFCSSGFFPNVFPILFHFRKLIRIFFQKFTLIQLQSQKFIQTARQFAGPFFQKLHCRHQIPFFQRLVDFPGKTHPTFFVADLIKCLTHLSVFCCLIFTGMDNLCNTNPALLIAVHILFQIGTACQKVHNQTALRTFHLSETSFYSQTDIPTGNRRHQTKHIGSRLKILLNAGSIFYGGFFQNQLSKEGAIFLQRYFFRQILAIIRTFFHKPLHIALILSRQRSLTSHQIRKNLHQLLSGSQRNGSKFHILVKRETFCFLILRLPLTPGPVMENSIKKQLRLRCLQHLLREIRIHGAIHLIRTHQFFQFRHQSHIKRF